MTFEIEPAIAADEITGAPLNLETGAGAVGASPWRRVAGRFRHNIPAMCALGFIVLVVLMALCAPLIAPYSPSDTNLGVANSGPSSEFLLGTDSVGRDILSRLIYGAQASMLVAFLVVGLATIVAVPLGLASGYFGRWAGAVIDRCMDALFTFPPLTLALAVAALLGASLTNTAIAVAIVFVPGFVRLIRAQVLAVREETFIEASRSVGVGDSRMLRKHVFPNVVSPLIVQAALAFGFAIGAEAGLSFLGFGVQAPTPSWGVLLQSGYQVINEDQWQLVPPVFAILLTILAFNLVGDGLRDSLGRESFAMGEG
jgi:ABC-type dipeptide/oligopeptide/nickel transport system permease subunit